MLVEGKETFKDFTESEEAIATNILSARLKFLEEMGIILKTKRPNNKKTNLYLLTEKGLALTPILLELATWSDSYLRDIHPAIADGAAMELLRNDKAAFANALIEKYREKRVRLLVSLTCILYFVNTSITCSPT
jgi:DNA-binding HxlR family transcriptional regulator